MNPLFEAAREIGSFFEHRDWQFCIIGGLAVVRWGEPQATQDVDVCLFTGFGDEQGYVDEILAHFDTRISDARRFALDSRVLLLAASNGAAIDVVLGGIPYEEQLIRRATPFGFAEDVSLMTCSAEDLIILKAFAGRDKDWAAVEGILARQADSLDFSRIDETLALLCRLKGEPETLDRLAAMRKEIKGREP